MDLPINQIIQGDCLEILKTFPDKSVDLVLTDPPYGIKRDKGFGGFGGFGTPIARRRYDDDWDSKRPTKEVFDELLRTGKLVLIFGGNFFANLLPMGTHWIVWDKKNTMPTFGDAELIWTNSDRKSVKIITREYNGLIGKEEQRQHPTQKPLDLLQKIIRDYSDEKAIILDPFLGSGTTAVAAKMEGRNYIGIEISSRYVDIAKKRVAAAPSPLFSSQESSNIKICQKQNNVNDARNLFGSIPTDKVNTAQGIVTSKKGSERESA